MFGKDDAKTPLLSPVSSTVPVIFITKEFKGDTEHSIETDSSSGGKAKHS